MRTWLHHWLFWVLLILLVVLSALAALVLSLRSIGEREYQQFIRTVRASGEIATIDEYIASLPPVNKTVQDEWRAAIALMPYSEEIQKFRSHDWHNVFIGKAQPAVALLKDHEAARLFAEPLIDLLLTHKAIVSAHGFLAHDFPPDKIRDLHAFSKLYIPNLLQHRSFAQWLQAELFQHPENTRALLALDSFTRAGSATLIESMISIAMQSIRDETYAALAFHHQLSQTTIEPWLTESPNGLAFVGDGFWGERVLFINYFYTALRASSLSDHSVFLSSSSSSTLGNVESLFASVNGLYLWTTNPHDFALISQSYDAITKRLRGQSVIIPRAYDVQKKFWGLGRIMMGNLIESAITALEHESNHRRIRLAVRLMNDLTLPLPADTNALIQQFPYAADYLRPPRDALHQVYERVSDTRFRLVIDPASPPVDFDDATRMGNRSQMLGKPARKEPYVWNTHFTEIDLAARPVAPAASATPVDSAR
jgi:hypothetical protein